MEDSKESVGTCCELVGLGGVRPRFTAPFSDSGVSCPRMDLISEEDCSWGAGLFGNSGRKVAPILGDRLLLRVSSFFKSIKFGFDFESRTIPEDGTADDLSMACGSLVGAWV